MILDIAHSIAILLLLFAIFEQGIEIKEVQAEVKRLQRELVDLEDDLFTENIEYLDEEEEGALTLPPSSWEDEEASDNVR